jgi:hypothetical protein
VLLAAGVLAAAVAPAFGLGGKVVSLFAAARAPHPAQSWDVVGRAVPPTPGVRASARLTRVDVRTLRQIAAGGAGFRHVALLAAIGEDGRPWLAQSGPGWTSDFFPLFGEVADVDRRIWRTRTPQGWDGWRFPMYGRVDTRRAIFTFAAFGGPRPESVTWATLVGFARGDVARLVVVGADGSRRERRLGGSRGFAFATRDPAALPVLLVAYDGAGNALARDRIKLEPLSP